MLFQRHKCALLAGPLTPCICSIANIFDGVTLCFSVTNGIPITNTTDGSVSPQKVASPSCSVFSSAYTCGSAVNIRTLVYTNEFPNNTAITGRALLCKLNEFNGPVPAPSVANVSFSNSDLSTSPDYTGRFNHPHTTPKSYPSDSMAYVNHVSKGRPHLNCHDLP